MIETTSSSITLEAKNLSKHFGNVHAVQDLSFSITKGETLGVLGANGAGKTTLMQMLLGLVTPSSGTVHMFGKVFLKHRIELLKRINFSSTYANLPSNLTVYQNMRVFSELYGVRDANAKIDELLELFRIQDLKYSVTGHLSSGESTRLNLCKALINDPELLLLDEPTASLDPDIADVVRQTLKRIQAERELSILYTSHNMRDIEAICQRIFFVHKGKCLTEGTPKEILERYGHDNLEDVFIDIART